MSTRLLPWVNAVLHVHGGNIGTAVANCSFWYESEGKLVSGLKFRLFSQIRKFFRTGIVRLSMSNGLSGTTDPNKWVILFRKILMNHVVYC